MEKRIIKRNPCANWRLEDKNIAKNLNKYAIFIILRNELFELNLIGAEIWLLCDGNRTKDDIVEILSKNYKVSREKLYLDIENFFSEMLKLDLLISC